MGRTLSVNLNQVILFIGWFAGAGVIYILALIARFYEINSGEKTYYRFFVMPPVVFGAATARYSNLDRWGGDWLGDLLLFVGGAVLLGLCYHLYHRMTSGRP